MIQSLKRYLRFFGITLLLKGEKLILVQHFIGYFLSKSFIKALFNREEKGKSLELAIDWLLLSHKNMTDGGMGTYYIVDGWTSSYPETSGYIIPTLYNYLPLCAQKKNEIEATIIECANWLVDIQKPSGGWQSHYVSHHKPEVVFNTGQVLRGLVIAYQLTRDDKYLRSMEKAADWLVEIQEENGSWVKMASMNEARVYDSYVSHPLLLVNSLVQKEKYKLAAKKNLDWILTQQQTNGWFKNADNTQKHNDAPILHTIAYTIDGLINCGLILNEPKYIEAGQKAADQLLRLFNQNQYLQGRFNRSWVGSEYMICTGCAQISIVWETLYEMSKDAKYLPAINRINNQLVYIQQSCLTIQGNGNGAIPGSFPIWGKYEPFGFPNWATKYFADALMCELKH